MLPRGCGIDCYPRALSTGGLGTAMAGQAEQVVEKAKQAAETLSPGAEETKAFIQYLFSPETLLDRLGSVVLVIILSLLAWLAVITIARRIQRGLRAAMEEADDIQRRRYQRALTGLSLITNIFKWTIIIGGVLAGLIALGLGPKLLPVLAGAGVLGLAIGFGAQTLVRDLIAGLFVLLEGQYGVGDFVQISGVFGQVVAVGLRVTVIQDINGRRHFFPNGSIGIVAVYDDPWTEWVVDVLVEDPGHAEEALRALQDVARVLAGQYPQAFTICGEPETVEVQGSVSVRLPVATFADQDWVAKEELLARLNSALEKAGVKLVPNRPPRIYADIARTPFAPVGPAEAPSEETTQ